MTSTIFFGKQGSDQGWAHARMLGAALEAAGTDVVRITDGDDRLAGAFAAPGLGTEALQARVAALRGIEGVGEFLEGVEIETLDAARLDELSTVPLRNVSAALFGSAGAPYHQLDLFASSGFDVAPIGSKAIQDGALETVDVFVMPGGGWEFMEGQLSRLGVDGAKAINDFVTAGGCYLSSCAGTHSILQQPAEAVKEWHPAFAEMPKLSAESWLKGSRNTHYVRSPGIGVIRVRPHDRSHPVALGLPAEFDCVYYNGPIILPDGEGYVSVLDCLGPDPDHYTPGETLFGNEPVALRDTAIAEAGDRAYSAGGVQPHGKGWLAGFGLHPEFGCEPSMLQWGIGARLLVNVADWTTGRTSAAETRGFDPSAWAADAAEAPSPEATRSAVLALLGEIEAGFQRLAGMPASKVTPWLDREIARSAFGLGPAALWQSSLEQGASLASAMAARIDVWKASCDTVRRQAGTVPSHVAGRMEALLGNATRVVSLPTVDAEPQDLGFKGLFALLSDVRTLLDTLTVGGEFQPYKAVAMSYLSAFGRLTAASLTLSASQAMLARAHLTGEFASIAPSRISP
jgi:hypothetical protein